MLRDHSLQPHSNPQHQIISFKWKILLETSIPHQNTCYFTALDIWAPEMRQKTYHNFDKIKIQALQYTCPRTNLAQIRPLLWSKFRLPICETGSLSNEEWPISHKFNLLKRNYKPPPLSFQRSNALSPKIFLILLQ